MIQPTVQQNILQVPQENERKLVRKTGIISSTDSGNKEVCRICRSNFDCNDDENECVFCAIDRSGEWYAKCKLYNERLKQYGKYHIAICCDKCCETKNMEKKE